METAVVEMSYNVFTASTVLIGIALVLLPPTWKTIREKRLKYPHLHWGNLHFKTDKVQNKNFKSEITWLNTLVWGMMLLGSSIVPILAAITGIAFTMLNIHAGPFQSENYDEARWFLAIGIGIFVAGFILIGIVRIHDFSLFLHSGKTDD